MTPVFEVSEMLLPERLETSSFRVKRKARGLAHRIHLRSRATSQFGVATPCDTVGAGCALGLGPCDAFCGLTNEPHGDVPVRQHQGQWTVMRRRLAARSS